MIFIVWWARATSPALNKTNYERRKAMGDFEYKIIKRYGVIADHNGVTLELNNPEKLDLRAWSKGYAKGGITLTKDDVMKLKELIDQQCKNKMPVSIANNDVKIDKTISKLDTKKEEVTSNLVKDNVIKLPLLRPEITKIVTEGNATYEDCKKKLDAEKEIYKDSDSQYVLDGLLELCLVDEAFRNNVMREDKNFAGVMDYMADMCKKGYGYMAANNRYGYVDRDLGLGLAIDYFNSETKPKTTAVTTTSSEPKKRGCKKKGA